MKNIVIGIAGGSASGKTTLVHNLEKEFGENVSVLSHDYYYKSYDNLPFEERIELNFDHPNAFETSRMIADIKKLKDGKSIKRPVYSFEDYIRTDKWVLVKPKKVIIVEGILVFESKDLVNLFDIKVFVDTDSDIRLVRRILRDIKSRSRSIDSVIAQYIRTVKPMHDEFVEPSKRVADIIIPQGGKNKVAVRMLKERIKSILRSHNYDD